MKIGIITFHLANNIGAVLQTHALQYYVRNNIGNCEIINFYPNNGIPKYSGVALDILRKLKKKIPYINSRYEYIRDYKFDKFRNDYLNISEKYYYGDQEFKTDNLPYDVIISGSDQILNMTLTGNSFSYYLHSYEGKKVSYASSFGRNNISDLEIAAIRSELPKFSALSVREQSGADIIKKEIGIEPQLVMDPVFLLSKDEWCKRCNEELKLPEKYIFVYSMEVSPVLENAVSTIKEETGLPVIVVRGGGKPGLIEGNEDGTCGPEEFLRYIRDAEIVITNSFHGTAFSLIFEKKFLCVAHSTRNARLENIMHLINQDEKMICHTSEKYNKKVIYGDKSISNLERYIDLSRKYLTQNII